MARPGRPAQTGIGLGNLYSTGLIFAPARGSVTGIDATIGSDGLPVVVMRDPDTSGLVTSRCDTTTCSGKTFARPVLHDTASTSLEDPSITVGSDGLPIVAFVEVAAAPRLVVAKCADLACSSGTTVATVVQRSSGSIQSPSIAIGTDGLPMIAYVAGTASTVLEIVDCNDLACAGNDDPVVNFQITTTNGASSRPQLRIAPDGLPMIAFEQAGGGGLISLLRCSSGTCAGGLSIQVVANPATAVDRPSFTFGDGGFPVIAYRDTVSGSVIQVLACNDMVCPGDTPTTIDDPFSAGASSEPIVRVGIDGLPVIAFRESTNGDIVRVVHCAAADCAQSSLFIVTVADPAGAAFPEAMLIGVDDDPLIVTNEGGATGFVHCATPACIPHQRDLG